MENIKQFLYYAATHPDAIVAYRASDMVVSVHINVSYLYKKIPEAEWGGHFFMSSDSPESPNNGVILDIAQIIKTVMSS